MKRIPNRLWARVWPHALCCLAALGLTACSTVPKVQTEQDPAVDFSRYKSFALLSVSATGPGLDPGAAIRLRQPAEQTVRAELTGKGFSEDSQQQADFVVNVRGQSLPRVDVTDYGYTRYSFSRYGYIPVHVGEKDVRTYDERTLAIEVCDNKTRKVSWVGWMRREATGPIEIEKLQQAIRSILANFPPGSTNATK